MNEKPRITDSDDEERQVSVATETRNRLIDLTAKAVSVIEEALENGDIRVALFLLKHSSLLESASVKIRDAVWKDDR